MINLWFIKGLNPKLSVCNLESAEDQRDILYRKKKEKNLKCFMLIFIIALNHPSFGIAKEIFEARISVYIKIFWKYQNSYFSELKS